MDWVQMQAVQKSSAVIQEGEKEGQKLTDAEACETASPFLMVF
jgi:hypothetical protein